MAIPIISPITGASARGDRDRLPRSLGLPVFPIHVQGGTVNHPDHHHTATHSTTSQEVPASPATDGTSPATPPPPSGSTHHHKERDYQRAYLLLQVMESPEHQLAKGKANRFPRAVARELNLNPTLANTLRDELVQEGLLRTLKKSGSIVYEVTDRGKAVLPTLEQKPVPEGRKPVREGPVSDEGRLH